MASADAVVPDLLILKLMPDCLPCFKDHISCGNTELVSIGSLEADAAYKWVLTTPQGAKYSGNVTTNASGQFTITVADLPDGLLNPYAGMFTLQVFPADAYQCNSVTWNDSAYCTPYDCIEFEVVNGDDVKNTLGCECDLI